MTTSTKYNITFPGIKPGTFKDKDIILPISLPLPPYTSSWLGDNETEYELKLKSVLSYIADIKPKSFHIVLADTLQRFTLLNANGYSENEARDIIEEKGKKFLQFLSRWLDIYSTEIGTEHKVIKWQNLTNDKEYTRCLEDTEKMYNTNLEFKEAIHSTALQFLKSSRLSDTSPESIAKAMANNICYVKEEIAVLLKWKYNFLIYPSKPTPAISKAYEAFSSTYKNLPKYELMRIYTKKTDTITEQLNAYKNAFELLPGNMYYKNRSGNYVWCNKHFAEILGFSSTSQVTGKTDDDFLEESLANQVIKNDIAIMNGGEPTSCEEYGLNKQKIKTPYFTTKTPIRNKNGDVVGLLGISIDITDRKKSDLLQKEKEVAEEISKAVEAMSGFIAHEVRTPLSIVGINIDFIKNYLENTCNNKEHYNKLKKNINDIKFAINYGSHTTSILLNNLQHFLDKKNPNKPNIKNLETTSARKLINKSISEYPLYDNERKIISWEDKPDHDFDLMCDTIITKQILFNLIKNALWAINEANKGNIHISLKKGTKENNIIFRDTALGIPSDLIENIFKPFITNRNNGSGLGLAFCKTMMQIQNGDIACNSKLGEYTEFTLSFPNLEKN